MKYNDNSNFYVTGYAGPEPVTLDDVKRRLNMKFDTDGAYEFNEDDVLITDLIVTARKWCENWAGIAIREQTIVCELRNECGGVTIPFGPIDSIVSAVDSAGADMTLTYNGGKWKTVVDPLTDYCKITYKAGYATLALNYAALPKDIKDAIIAVAVKMYVDRGETDKITTRGVSIYTLDLAKTLLAPYNKRAWLT